ncbi:unannotated protein [freshwater metagenome]|jgi:hypothetical protein|uniref:Unannotated protein n=1 Tax=freshwater metagenome TaxID=449393 RepID=A0A6J6KE43_9ZZZZ|nr:DUF3071 domain-containing protein [Actinomycetota bacterium]MTA79531.1 DUF3071 domain-containing protein [Actinomycetota bacterium]
MNESTDLRLVGRSSDGTELELIDQDGNKFNLRISDTLRSNVNQPRLSAVSDFQEEVTTTVKEVQARLRGGESIDSISRTTDWSIEKVENFAGPILQERAFIIAQALATQIKREPHAPYLETAVSAKLAPRGVDMATVEWNTHRKPDGNWEVTLYYPLRDGSAEDAKGEAVWVFNLGRRSLLADDDGARWIGGEEKQRTQPTVGMVYTEAPRLVSIKEDIETHTTTSFTVVDDAPDDEARKDGVTRRIKIPSWDDIMFGKDKED